MNVLVFSAHPDDAEFCCGGTICSLTEAGHRVHIINLTCSQPVRAVEAAASAKVMGATVECWNFPDGALRVNDETLSSVQAAIEAFRPHLVLAHWPVDFHPDHQAVGSLALQALHLFEGKLEPWPELHLYEACLGYQSYHFHPNHYVDISAYTTRKREAAACNVSVDCLSVYPIHETMQKMRGYESGFPYAEGFVRIPFRCGVLRDNVVGDGVESPA